MTEPQTDSHRRLLLKSAAFGATVALSGCAARVPQPNVDDVTQIDRVYVDRILRPTTTEQIQAALASGRGAISIGGGRYSMGDQIAAENSLHLDMRGMNRLLAFDPAARTVRVQSGMTWRDLQDIVDPHELSVKVMQSYCNFTVGGSISVNCHGRYVGKGPIINTVRALRLIAADGNAIELDRNHRPDWFDAVIGGYGGLGVVSEVELELDENCRIERRVRECSLADYPAFFREQVLTDPDIVFHNADLPPPRYDAPLATSWRRTQLPLTETQRLIPRDADYGKDQKMIWAVTELPGGESMREHFYDRKLLHEPSVVYRNHEASLDVRSLEPWSRRLSTYLLQEYFIPVENFAAFCADMRRILAANEVHALNVSIRHSPADTRSLLRWAPKEVFSFALYYKQRSWAAADRDAERWTRQLIDAALAQGGRYYLPYRLHASREQFERAYPEHVAFARIKQAIDPDRRFRNRMWDKYLSS